MSKIADGTHPGLLLKVVVLPELRLTVSRAAHDLGVSRQALHRLMAGQASMSLDMAVRLEKFCGIPSWFWLERQAAYDLRNASSEKDLSVVTHALSSATLRDIGLHGR